MRYRGPKAKVMRRFGLVMAASPKYSRILEKRPNPPGQHGGRAKRKKVGAYGSRLVEKQKLKAFYGVAERQIRRYVAEAMRQQGPTGTNLLRILEQRLDAVVYRLGFAPSIWAARQLVGHGHVLVNGKRVDIPSYHVRPNDTLTLSEKFKRSRQLAIWLERGGIVPPAYLELDRDQMNGRLVRVPERDEIPVPIDDRLIVEFYSR
ncbi:MAG TPA: 30S ribosomal protein S4 [Thermoanaerobaculia bacterium]|nr:30S ribosomal protein S4 [Thermoanaerobaculia bacterium]